MKKALLFFYFISQSLLAQDKVQVVDSGGEGVPYATLFFDNMYGFVTDSLGFFQPKLKTVSLRISAVGFEELNVKVSDLPQKVVLKRATYVLEDVVIRSNKRKKAKLGHSSVVGGVYSHFGISNFEIGEIIPNPNKISGVIEKITVKAGFRGEGGANFRLILYSLDKQGLPERNIIKEDIIFHVSGKLKNYTFNIANQYLILPENGLMVGVEILNPKKIKFNSNFIPILGFKLMKDGGQTVIRSEASNGWEIIKLSTNPLLFSLDVKY